MTEATSRLAAATDVSPNKPPVMAMIKHYHIDVMEMPASLAELGGSACPR